MSIAADQEAADRLTVTVGDLEITVEMPGVAPVPGARCREAERC